MVLVNFPNPGSCNWTTTDNPFTESTSQMFEMITSAHFAAFLAIVVHVRRVVFTLAPCGPHGTDGIQVKAT